MNGNTIEVKGKDIPDLLSENDELKNKVETLQGELQGLQDALQGKEEGLGKHSDVQIVVNLLNENDEVLYTSPILSLLTPDLHFEVETKDCLKLKIAAEAIAAKKFMEYEIDEFYVRNLTAVTTEY